MKEQFHIEDHKPRGSIVYGNVTFTDVRPIDSLRGKFTFTGVAANVRYEPAKPIRAQLTQEAK